MYELLFFNTGFKLYYNFKNEIPNQISVCHKTSNQSNSRDPSPGSSIRRRAPMTVARRLATEPRTRTMRMAPATRARPMEAMTPNPIQRAATSRASTSPPSPSAAPSSKDTAWERHPASPSKARTLTTVSKPILGKYRPDCSTRCAEAVLRMADVIHPFAYLFH